MRTIVALGVGLVVAAGPVRAGDREAALGVIDRAIKAHGGEAGLAKAAVASRTESGFNLQGGQEVPFTSQVVHSLPDRVRLAVVLDKKFPFLLVLDGDKGWQQAGGSMTVELPGSRLKEMREEAYVWWLATLAPLKKDLFTLAPVPDARVDGQPAAGVKVSCPGHADTRLYFDKRSGLLVKIARRVPEAGVPVDKEYLYSDYKEFDGVKLPAKEVMTINGKKWSERTASAVKFLSRPDKKAFAKP
jgi:hypothetical protein